MSLIEKINVLKEKERQKLSKQLKDAKANYADTGRDSYYKKICRIEKQIDEIDGSQPVTVAEINNIKKLHEKHMREIKNRVNEFIEEEPLNIEFKHFAKWLDNYIIYAEKEIY
ncbi:hypothetical protein [Ruminiclostridium josui]|uniref:hypothetical protein n=1 Tax=Ruminiclostridium josui TaxID=1499 RepID=UPI0004667AA5|nr:hypothetical protein [Ruminiclostridium josui]